MSVVLGAKGSQTVAPLIRRSGFTGILVSRLLVT